MPTCERAGPAGQRPYPVFALPAENYFEKMVELSK